MKKEDIKQKMQKPKKEAKKPKKIARIIIILILFGTTTYCKAERVFDGWRVLPIRREKDYNAGVIGGEGMQHMHSIARSRYNPDIIYLSHDGGQLWKSRDGGETWGKPLGIGLFLPNGQSIEVDPIDPDIVFFVVDQWWGKGKEEFEGLYKSEDGGDSWKQVKQMNPGVLREYQHAIAYDFTNTTEKRAMTWYVAAPSEGLFRSDDGGDIWSESLGLTDPNIKKIYDIEAHGQTVWVGTNRGLYRSNNKGEGIAPCGNLPEGIVSSVEINQNIVYAAVRKDGLYKSTDGGNTFVELKDYFVQCVFMNPGFPDTLYMAKRDFDNPKTIITHDGGQTWNETYNVYDKVGDKMYGWGSRVGAKAGFAPNPTDANEAVCYSEAKIFKTIDGGNNFKDSSTLFTGYYWYVNGGIAFDPTNPDRFFTFNADVGVKLTENGGDYFITRNGTAPNRIWEFYVNNLTYGHHGIAGDIHPTNPDLLIVSVGDWSNRDSLIRTEDGGVNWEVVTPRWPHRTYKSVQFNTDDPNTVYAHSKISCDGGQTFNDVNFAPHGSDGYLKPSSSDILYATCNYQQTLLRSDNKGKTWYLCYKPNWGKPIVVWKISPVAVDPKNPDIVYTRSYKYQYKNKSAEGDLVRGVWNGRNMSWERLGLLDKIIEDSNGTPLYFSEKFPLKVTKIVIDPNHPEIIYAGVGGLSGVSHIWRSIDSGKNWEDITYNLPRQGVGGMAINPHSGELMIGSFYGTWIFPPPYESKNLIYNKAVSRPSCHDGLKNGQE